MTLISPRRLGALLLASTPLGCYHSDVVVEVASGHEDSPDFDWPDGHDGSPNGHEDCSPDGDDGSEPDGAAGYDGDHGGDGGDADGGDADGGSACGKTDKLDVLFVIDNSKSMAEEQAKLSVQLPKLLNMLTSGDLNDDGLQDFQPVVDLHLGVVSSDMGASGAAGAPTCGTNNNFGDDGVLIQTSRAAQGPCVGRTLPDGRYYGFIPGQGPTAAEAAGDVACVAALGIDGCGFEQPLEAMYKALAPRQVTFAKGSGGHGDELNAGFLRTDALLAVIHVSDEEDCSITDEGAALFIPGATGPAVQLEDGRVIGLNLRCMYKASDSSLVHPTARYVDGLKALKPDHPERIFFAALTGTPPELDGAPLEEVLAHDSMQFQPDPNSPSGGDPSDNATPASAVCQHVEGTTVLTHAQPAKRFVEVAAGFGDHGVVRSICNADFGPALQDLTAALAEELGSPNCE